MSFHSGETCDLSLKVALLLMIMMMTLCDHQRFLLTPLLPHPLHCGTHFQGLGYQGVKWLGSMWTEIDLITQVSDLIWIWQFFFHMPERNIYCYYMYIYKNKTTPLIHYIKLCFYFFSQLKISCYCELKKNPSWLWYVILYISNVLMYRYMEFILWIIQDLLYFHFVNI